MNAIIIEDEKPAARRLQRLLSKQEVSVKTMLHSVEEAVHWFQNHPAPQLIFLDIQLGDGLSFEIFDQVEVKSAIIFTTAYDEYALKAFKLNSIDYLLKPIDKEELKVAVAKYARQQFSPKIDLQTLRKMLKEDGILEKTYKKRFTIKVGRHLRVLSVEEVVCFYSQNKGTYLQVETGRNYLLDTTLEQLETELNPNQFFRVNRKFIINIDDINDITQYSNSRLKINLKHYKEKMIIVSRERVRDFKSWLGE